MRYFQNQSRKATPSQEGGFLEGLIPVFEQQPGRGPGVFFQGGVSCEGNAVLCPTGPGVFAGPLFSGAGGSFLYNQIHNSAYALKKG